MLNKVRHILFDPLAWINPSRLKLPDRFNTLRCRSLINDRLLQYYQLPTDGINLDNAQERFLVANWSLLPAAAFMVACQRYRLQLARTGLFARLDRATRQFALAELTPVHDNGVQLGFAELWHCASNELSYFANGCSNTLTKRVGLLFPETAVAYASGTLNNNEFLLKMAVQNAKRSIY